MTTPSPPASQRVSEVRTLLEQALPLMGVEAHVVVTEAADGSLQADISSNDLSILIGGRGRTLNALQCLANVAANSGHDGDWTRVVLDAEGYRERRKESLESCAEKLAAQALEEDREVELEPMNAFERRIVHCALAERVDVVTGSRGEEPYRCVVIAPAPAEEQPEHS